MLPSSKLAVLRGRRAPLRAQPGKELRGSCGCSHGHGLRGSWPWVLFLAFPIENRAVGLICMPTSPWQEG